MRHFNNNEFELLEEEFEEEFEQEVNRSSSIYIKWVQSSLNRILGLRLAVDGIRGPNTRSAIRSFQSKKGLTVDGIVGPNIEAAMIKAGASQPPGSSSPPKPRQRPSFNYPGTGSGSPVLSGSLRNNLVSIAIKEWNKWGQGTIKESSSSMQSILKDYWVSGTGSDYGYINKLAWSAAFISWVAKKAGGGSNFKYSGAHTTYTYYAKQNKLQNNSNPFKAYRITEKKPEPGDIIVQNRGSSAFTYDNLQPDRSGTHGDIVVKVNSNSIEVLGGNLSDSISKNSYKLTSNGFLNSSAHFAIIKIEETNFQNEIWDEFELIPELESIITSSGSQQEVTLAETKMVQDAILKGERNENVLSDMVFFARHPELGRKPLYKGQTGFDNLSNEWLEIRDKIVRAALLRKKIVQIAKEEWKRWGQGLKVETDPNMAPILFAYWKYGPGYNNNIKIPKTPWSAAFISFVIRKAYKGSDFHYNQCHSIYTYYSKENRLKKGLVNFKAYDSRHVKPEVGDIVIVDTGSGVTYNNLSKDCKSSHGDIVVGIKKGSIAVIGGNTKNYTSGDLGVTVSLRIKLLDEKGFLADKNYFAIIKP